MMLLSSVIKHNRPRIYTRLFILRIAVVIACLNHSIVQASDLDQCKELTAKSFDACSRLAGLANTDGLVGLAFLYAEGVGVEKNQVESYKLMLKAAMLGEPEAQFLVGISLVYGRGVEVNYERAHAWFLIATENGNEFARDGIDYLNQKELVRDDRLSVITALANELYAKTKSKYGFPYQQYSGEVKAKNIIEYCNLVMPTVDSIILLKSQGHPQSSAQQLLVGLTDEKSINMASGVISWVWSIDIPNEQMHDNFKTKCLAKSAEVDFMF